MALRLRSARCIASWFAIGSRLEKPHMPLNRTSRTWHAGGKPSLTHSLNSTEHAWYFINETGALTEMARLRGKATRGSWITYLPTRLLAYALPSRPKGLACAYLRPTRPSSTPSRTPSASSGRYSARLQLAPSRTSGPLSPTHFRRSRLPSSYWGSRHRTFYGVTPIDG